MAPLIQRLLFLGIILLLTNHYVKSSPARIPSNTVKGKETSDTGHTENEVKNSVGQREEREKAESEDDRGQKPVESQKEKEQTNEEAQKRKVDDRENSAKSKIGGIGGRLGDDQSKCAEDIARLCPEIPKGNNFALLVCLQEKAKEDDLSTDCHHMLWEYKRKFSKDQQFENKVKDKFCAADLKNLPECAVQGKIIPCLLEHRRNLTVPSCKHMMTRMQAIFFSDYRLIENFLDDCSKDVHKFSCGRLQTEEEDEEDIHSQNEVLECLEEHQEELSQQCQKQIYRLAELSSDDYHLDRPLFYACKDDRERFCEQVPSGEGRVYKCLKKHKDEETMSDECRDKLTERQKFEAKDPKANYPLMKNCLEFYRQYKDKYECERGRTKHGALANILVCLEKAVEDDQKVSGKCQAEMFDLRQQLMDDFFINPEIVAKCDVEIESHCRNGGEKGGKTIDCLMSLAEENEGENNVIRAECVEAIETLLEETGAGTDYRIDHTLYAACEPVVQTVCKDKGKKEGDVMVLSCLMENLHTDNMIPECEEQLLHLEFFIARDFKLDPEIKRLCKDDAKTVCGASSLDDQESYPNSLVISCLYRNSVLDTQTKVSPKCAAHVQRVMHQRAVDVHLMPEIQIACVQDLGKHCSERVEKGEVLECLRDHRRELSDPCKDALFQREEEEIEDPELDYKLRRPCKKMIKMFCNDVEPSEMFSCLKENKHKPEFDKSCSDMITKRQIRQSQDVRLNPQLMKFCKLDIPKFCKDIPKGEGKTIECLKKNYERLSEECQEYTKRLIRQAAKDFRLDTRLVEECKAEIKKFCAGSPPSAVEECLKSHLGSVTTKNCRVEIVRQMREGRTDIQADPVLYKACANDVKRHCSDIPFGKGKVMKCLLEAHDSNPARFDRECLIHLSSRLRMWELAAKILPPNYNDFPPATSPSPSKKFYYFNNLLIIVIIVMLTTCLAVISLYESQQAKAAIKYFAPFASNREKQVLYKPIQYCKADTGSHVKQLEPGVNE